jgi:hypothetical protein
VVVLRKIHQLLCKLAHFFFIEVGCEEFAPSLSRKACIGKLTLKLELSVQKTYSSWVANKTATKDELEKVDKGRPENVLMALPIVILGELYKLQNFRISLTCGNSAGKNFCCSRIKVLCLIFGL